jgi:hypothetical protein
MRHLPDPDPRTGFARSVARSLAASALGLAACSPEQELLLTDATAASGIDFVHEPGVAGFRELPETMGAGVGMLDAEGDGDWDLYFVQSGPMRRSENEPSRESGRNALYLGDGRARFTAAPDAAGAADDGYGQGVSVGDVNGDGLDDLFVLNWGPNQLYVNRGGRFEPSAGIEPGDAWSVSGCFVDIDADGDLDLYEVNYLVCPPDSHLDASINGDVPNAFKYYPHPDHFRAEPDRLWLNDGTGQFRDATADAGLDVVPQKGLGVVATDVDLDGWPDLYVTNDSTPNLLFHNRTASAGGALAFDSIERSAGVAYNDDGMTEAGMGVDAGDVDRDGRFDLFATNLDVETNTLYLNRSEGERIRFVDFTRRAKIAAPSKDYVGFGVLFEDVDGDGNLDLVVANGHIMDNIGELTDARTYAQPNQLFLGDGAGGFELAPAELVDAALAVPTVSRGLVPGDLNGDGALDFVVSNNAEGPQLYLGRPAPAERVRITCSAGPGNPRGLGASVRLVCAYGSELLRRIEASRSYGSAGEPSVTTGLPAGLERVEVLWPGGEWERFEGGGTALHLVRGQGVAF